MMNVLTENEKIEYFQKVFRKYGRPIDFKFEHNRRIYFFKNSLVISITHKNGNYVIEESKIGLKEFFKKGEFTRIAIIYSLATSMISVLSAALEALLGIGSNVLTIGLLASSLTVLAATLHNMQKARK